MIIKMLWCLILNLLCIFFAKQHFCVERERNTARVGESEGEGERESVCACVREWVTMYLKWLASINNLASCMLKKPRLVLTNNQVQLLPLWILMCMLHSGYKVESDLAKAGRAGRKAMDLHRFIVVGVVLIVRHMVVALWASCVGKDVRERAVLV